MLAQIQPLEFIKYFSWSLLLRHVSPTSAPHKQVLVSHLSLEALVILHNLHGWPWDLNSLIFQEKLWVTDYIAFCTCSGNSINSLFSPICTLNGKQNSHLPFSYHWISLLFKAKPTNEFSILSIFNISSHFYVLAPTKFTNYKSIYDLHVANPRVNI